MMPLNSIELTASSEQARVYMNFQLKNSDWVSSLGLCIFSCPVDSQYSEGGWSDGGSSPLDSRSLLLWVLFTAAVGSHENLKSRSPLASRCPPVSREEPLRLPQRGPFPRTQCWPYQDPSSSHKLTLPVMIQMQTWMWKPRHCVCAEASFQILILPFFPFYFCHMLHTWKTSFRNHIFTS